MPRRVASLPLFISTQRLTLNRTGCPRLVIRKHITFTTEVREIMCIGDSGIVNCPEGVNFGRCPTPPELRGGKEDDKPKVKFISRTEYEIPYWALGVTIHST